MSVQYSGRMCCVCGIENVSHNVCVTQHYILSLFAPVTRSQNDVGQGAITVICSQLIFTTCVKACNNNCMVNFVAILP